MTKARHTRVRSIVATGLPGVLVLVALASLAQPAAKAADTCVKHPSDASVVCVRNDDTIVDVCDRDPDGHRAYARVVTRASGPGFQSPYYDKNDSRPGCSNVPFSSKVVSVAVCVQQEGCSAFKQTASPAAPPPAAPSPPASRDPVVYAAGDISCDGRQRMQAQRDKDAGRCRSLETYRKIRELEQQQGNPGLPNAVLALGDIQYERGSVADYAHYDRDWGPLRPVTFPVLGNHEYLTPRAAGYWRYFDPNGPSPPNRLGVRGKGWYAFDIGSWRLYAINSNCARQRGNQLRVSCARGSEQHRWLRRDIRANRRTCRLMFMHHPYWDSSRDNFDTPALRPLIEEFWSRGGDVVLAGHAHHYERFGRSDPDQRLVYSKTRRFRMFIVGTGGKQLRALGKPERNSRLRDNTDHGILELRLGQGNYGWRFASAVNTSGGVLADTGGERCNRPGG